MPATFWPRPRCTCRLLTQAVNSASRNLTKPSPQILQTSQIARHGLVRNRQDVRKDITVPAAILLWARGRWSMMKASLLKKARISEDFPPEASSQSLLRKEEENASSCTYPCQPGSSSP